MVYCIKILPLIILVAASEKPFKAEHAITKDKRFRQIMLNFFYQTQTHFIQSNRYVRECIACAMVYIVRNNTLVCTLRVRFLLRLIEEPARATYTTRIHLLLLQYIFISIAVM